MSAQLLADKLKTICVSGETLSGQKLTEYLESIGPTGRTSILEDLVILNQMNDWNEPMDAANRRAKRLAHIEHTKTMSAFHDGADTPEIRAAIDRAREKILKDINDRKPTGLMRGDGKTANDPSSATRRT